MNKKEIAQQFLQLCFEGNSQKAFKLYIDHTFIHHNAYYSGDADTLMLAMQESAENLPDKLFEMLHIIEDNNMVAVHSRMKPHKLAEQAFAVIHILRFNNDKIVEMWDFAQEVPKDCPNENGMF